MNEKEIHLFIIWEKGRYKEKDIINDLNNNFNIIKITEMLWSPNLFSENLTRFYGQNLPDKSEKEKHCGTGPFLTIVVHDENPRYRFRKTSRGKELVNVNIYDSKELYRFWTGGGHKIHATNSMTEANHDITMLTGYNAQDYTDLYYKNNSIEIEKIVMDVVGSDQWDSINQLFYVLNNTIPYVVLRNYESLPEQYVIGKHSDIDILTTDYQSIIFITNAKRTSNRNYRVQNRVKISNSYVNFDFRYVGDNYYDEKWQLDILNSSILHKNLFYIANYEHYYYSLIYHGLIHKPSLSEDYLLRLKELESRIRKKRLDNSLKEQLITFMNEREYSFVEPIDLSVRYNSVYKQPKSNKRLLYELLRDFKLMLFRMRNL